MTEDTVLPQIYLDANATTPVLEQAANAALITMKTMFGNPSSSHITGLQAKQLMEQTRQKARAVLGSGNGRVIFTSGATEGIQTGILSALCEAKKQIEPHKQYTLLYGATEHKAVPESLKHWNHILEINAEVKAIPVDNAGNLDFDFIAREVPNALMICTMAVNNETGVYQDLNALESVIRTHNADVFWMVDCVQALGKRNLNLARTTIDYAPFSGHKLYAPKGIGFVYIRNNAPFTPFIAGGGQESGLRSGTENLPGLAALDIIFDELLKEDGSQFVSVDKLHDYRNQLAQALTRAFPTIVFNNQFSNSVPTTLNFAIPGFSSKEIMDLFDAANIRVSSGSACSSKVTRSFVLDAMGLPAWQSESAIRMSYGPATTQTEIDAACERIQHCAQALGHSCLMQAHHDIDNKEALDGLVQFKVGGACCWLFADKQAKTAIIIDPLPELVERLNTILECQQLTLLAALDTHGHADHESSRVAFSLPKQACDHLGWPTQTTTMEYKGQQLACIPFGHYHLAKLPTPGHTEDSVSFILFEQQQDTPVIKYVFCGDLILMGALGRTNFPTSSSSAMFSSIQLLATLATPDTLLCPSHDYNNEFATTLSAESSRNGTLKRILCDEISVTEFVEKKALIDQNIVDDAGSEIMCGATVCSKDQFSLHEYTASELAEHMQHNNNLLLIDIREPHEYALNHNRAFDQNVPLTRLTDFIGRHNQDKSTPLVLVCRSGSRSQVAAQALARLGFNNIGHLKGGYALIPSA
ncbi:aminotransferase class V-fold PLP-dependent enzyme [Pseudoalteromonas piscicida]|uniref:cysteine desulfurase n=1 Tax=Pseudoalteromonas piscicida TaxID=43662 RepID=A0A2A5JPJ5_PSEO7|nr:aminotransferase class V-fold PLP-dependent enzyme [Pseudoalteromonas piscicida]PCK31373.1 aminotransferase class V [Pseudoalteromonas piscicida]